MGDEGAGLREEKKRRTRSRISDRATQLFLERGFERVSIAEIAAASGVAKMTVTNYFPRKEDLAFDLQDAFVDAAADAVRGCGAGESPLAAVREHTLASIAAQDPVIGFSGVEFAQMIVDSPTLTARLRELHEVRERALGEAIAATSSGDEPPAGLAAAMIGGVLRYLFGETMRLSLEGRDGDTIAREVDAEARRAFDVLESGLGPARTSGHRASGHRDRDAPEQAPDAGRPQ